MKKIYKFNVRQDKFKYSIRFNPDSWTYSLDDINRINDILEHIVEDRFGDTVYAKLRKNGKLQIEGDFTVEDLHVILDAIQS